jgi:hypothetical protein
MSEVKVNKISPRSGTTVTLGDSGDTFTIPSGATINNQGTATNFGATGSASWVTTVKTSSPFTAVAGEGYFVNTTAGPITVNLPAGTPGAVVAIKDYAGTFDTNKVTLVQNGSDKIGGSAVNSDLTIEGLAVTLVFIDSTQGWLVTDSGLQSEAPGEAYVVATGGTITCSGDYKIHTFTGPGTFNVTAAGNAAGSNVVDYLVVAGGGGGGGDYGAGAGAGGYRESVPSPAAWTSSPIAKSCGALPVSVQSYSVTIGAGGGKGIRDTIGTNGVNSTFSTITSAGGGFGGMQAGSPNTQFLPGGPGGSGGAAGYQNGPVNAGVGNTPPVSPAQGFNGGKGAPGGAADGHAGGGGGGAGGVSPNSETGTPNNSVSGIGGSGVTSCITASPVTRGGGGGGAGGGSINAPQAYTPGAGGPGGGGAGAPDSPPFPGSVGVAGTANTGGGGGGGNLNNPTSCGGNGGSGVVVIRYKYQN